MIPYKLFLRTRGIYTPPEYSKSNINDPIDKRPKDFGSSQFSNLSGLYSTLAPPPSPPWPPPRAQRCRRYRNSFSSAPVVISFRSHPVFRGRLVA
ncbi:hypothetical protein PUN28_001203 [Cardiocondyla obscurior]|uniref:Uncharacterized protein n=1 Tax=Cardiocondyla obscurior TaxID=286306 RepID=A0AAW2H451_9HYME